MHDDLMRRVFWGRIWGIVQWVWSIAGWNMVIFFLDGQYVLLSGDYGA